MMIEEEKMYYELDIKHLWHPWQKNVKFRENIIMTEGKGCVIKDIDGKEYIDATSGALNASCGFSNKKIVQRICDQMSSLMNFDLTRFSTIPAIQLAKKMADLLPEKLTRTFFCCSGSEATETASKLARIYFAIRNNHHLKKNIISFKNGYHGSTMGSICMSHIEFVQRDNLLPEGFYSIEYPKCKKCLMFEAHNSCVIPGPELLEEKIIELGPDTVAAFIMEPVMGIGGLVIPPTEYVKTVSEICHKYDILLIFDETMTGFGRTGEMFAFQHFNVVPDILITGKGITGGYFPLSAVTTTDEIYKTFTGDTFLKGFRHGHTNSGHASGCVAALATIEVIEEENLVENSFKLGEYLLQQLLPLENKYPYVRNIRGIGLIIALDVQSVELCGKITQMLFDNGLIVRQVNSTMGLLPPLVITQEEIERIIQIMYETFEEYYSTEFPLKEGIK